MVPSNQIPAVASTTKKPSITAFSTLRFPGSSGGSGAGPPPSVIDRSWLWRIEMNVAAIVGDTIARFRSRFTRLRKRICRRGRTCIRQIAGTDRRLAVAAGNVEHVIRLAQSGDPAPQAAHQLLPALKRRPQMRRAGREIAVM